MQGVFFDLYGTILTYGDMIAAWDEWLKEFHRQFTLCGLNMPKDEFSRVCDGFFSGKDPLPQDHLTPFELRIVNLSRKLNLSIKTPQVKQIAVETVSVWQNHVEVDPEAKEVLEILHEDKKTALISNFDHPPHVYNLLDKYGLRNLFDVVVISGAVGIKKPDPGIFQIALHRTNLDPRNVIFVGDAEVDIKGAQNSAINPVLLKRPGQEYNHETARDYRSGVADEEWGVKMALKEVAVIQHLKEILDII